MFFTDNDLQVLREHRHPRESGDPSGADELRAICSPV